MNKVFSFIYIVYFKNFLSRLSLKECSKFFFTNHTREYWGDRKKWHLRIISCSSFWSTRVINNHLTIPSESRRKRQNITFLNNCVYYYYYFFLKLCVNCFIPYPYTSIIDGCGHLNYMYKYIFFNNISDTRIAFHFSWSSKFLFFYISIS